MNIYELQGTFYLVVLVAMLAIKGFAFVNSLMYSSEAYEAAGLPVPVMDASEEARATTDAPLAADASADGTAD